MSKRTFIVEYSPMQRLRNASARARLEKEAWQKAEESARKRAQAKAMAEESARRRAEAKAMAEESAWRRARARASTEKKLKTLKAAAKLAAASLPLPKPTRQGTSKFLSKHFGGGSEPPRPKGKRSKEAEWIATNGY